MINPSASGWIDKFFIKQEFKKEHIFLDADSFYKKTRATGFIYGHIISFETPNPVDTKGWVQNEIPKVALLNGLYGIYGLISRNFEPSAFIKKLLDFYDEMHPQ